MAERQVEDVDAERLAVVHRELHRRNDVARLTLAGLVEHAQTDQAHLRREAAEVAAQLLGDAADDAGDEGPVPVIVLWRGLLCLAAPEVVERGDALPEVGLRLDPGVDDRDADAAAVEHLGAVQLQAGCRGGAEAFDDAAGAHGHVLGDAVDVSVCGQRGRLRRGHRRGDAADDCQAAGHRQAFRGDLVGEAIGVGRAHDDTPRARVAGGNGDPQPGVELVFLCRLGRRGGLAAKDGECEANSDRDDASVMTYQSVLRTNVIAAKEETT